MSDENYDIEFERLREHLERTFKAEIQRRLDEAEKRALMRAKGAQYCRLCPAEPVHLNPPASELERLWHEGNHGLPLERDGSRGLPAVPSAADWDEWEKAVKARRPK